MIDRDFGNWLAGFIDGEGCFYIATTSSWQRHGVQKYRPVFTLTVRSDDRDVVHEACSRTGLGSTHDYRAQSGNLVTRWNVQSKQDAVDLVELLKLYPLRAKKRFDLEVWERAVDVAATIKMGCKAAEHNIAVYATLKELKDELAVVRRKDIE